MENIESTQPESAQYENTESESVDFEEDASTADNSDSQFLKTDSPTAANNKTEEEKVAHNTDNLLNISVNSPKTALLGRLKAKQRLQAFLLPKQSPFLNSPSKKAEDIQIPIKVDKSTKKPKQSPIDKAKSIIEELEEIKKVEIAKLHSSPLFKETRSSYKEKHYRRKSRSRSLELVRKISEKGKYPESWHEMKSRWLSLENVQEIKLSKLSKSSKQQDNCYDFRKQLLFELPAQPLVSLKIKGTTGQEKTVPSPYIRFTHQLPSVSYSVNTHNYSREYLSISEIYNYIPKSHLDIIRQCKANSSEKLRENVSIKCARKWYPKQALSNITEGCELLEKSIGLSILQSYMDEEEEDERNDNNLLNSTETNETKMELQNKNEFRVSLQSTNYSSMGDGNSKFSENEELNNVEGEDISLQNENSSKKKQSKTKEEKTKKYKKDKKEKKEMRKGKRKKVKQEKDIKESKRKKNKTNKIDKKISDSKKENKSKKKDSIKLEKKNEIDEKKKHKEHKEREIVKTGKESYIESVPQIEIKKEKVDEKNSKKDSKELKKDDKTEDRKDFKKDEQKTEKKNDKKYEKKKIRNSTVTSSVPLYYDEFESIRGRSPSKEKPVIVEKVTHQKSIDSTHEVKKTDDSKFSKHSSSRKQNKAIDKFKRIQVIDDNKRNNIIDDVKQVDSKQGLKHDDNGGKKVKSDAKMGKQDSKMKEPEKMKDDCLFKIQPLHQEEELGTPDTEEYHSHWESDEDVSNVISYSPLLPRKLDTSWESDEDVNPDKMLLHDRYPEMLRNKERSPERRTRKYFEGERSLEMPLNIVNLSRNESRKSGKFLDYPDRKFLNTDARLRFEEDSWERGEFLKICNDIENEKLRHERKTLSEERRLLELEKRKLAEKLEKRSLNCDIFNNLEDSIVKEVTYEKIHDGIDEVYLKSTDYIYDKRKSHKDHGAKKTSEHKNRKRTHSIEDHKRAIEEDSKHCNQSDSKKFKYDKLDNIDAKYENESLLKYEIDDNVSKNIEEEKVFLLNSKDDYKPIDIVDVKKSSKSTKDNRDQSDTIKKSDKKSDTTIEKVHSYILSDVSERTCDSLLTSDTKTTSKSDILENEYEEFLKAVTSDISKSESKSKERKLAQKKRENKKKSRRRRKYSTSSSSSSSSDSDDSDSSSSSSSSSSYSSSSTSSYERQKKRRKLKAKRKKQQGKEKIVKIEMTHSIVKDLDDLQPFPISKTPIIQIKQEQEDPDYSKVPIVTLVTRELDNAVPLPVPSPAIVPPPYLNLLPIKQEKPDSSISTKADSTTSPIKKPPLIPTKFITPVPRKESNVISASCILDIPKKVDAILIKSCTKEDTRQSPSGNSSPFTSLIASKRSCFNDSTNDLDIQEFTEYLAKKSKIDEMRSCKAEFPTEQAAKANQEDAPAERKDNARATKEEDAYFQNELNNEVYKGGSPENISRGSLVSPPPKEVSDTERKYSESRDVGNKIYSESSRRSSRRSLSPKYRNQSPRRDSLPRKSRDTSPYWKSSRHPDDPLTRKYSPRRRRSMERSDKRRKSPSPRGRKSQSFRSRTSISPRRRKSISPRSRRSPLSPRMRRLPSPGFRRSPSPGLRRSPSPRIRRSLSPRRCRSPSPGIRRSLSPVTNRSMSPRGRKSPFRNRSPSYRSSPPRKSYRRNYSRSPSPPRKKESIQRTLQRLAGIEDHYQQPLEKSPINSPVDGFKRSVADSTISDDQLLQLNFNESLDSPAYRTSSTRLIQSPCSPKRVPLDIRINQVLGLDKESPKPITTTYTQTNYGQNYTYDQYSEQYEHYHQYSHNILQKENYIQQQPTSSQIQGHVGSSKVLQVGNVLQVVPTEEIPPQEHKQPPMQKIVQVGNMLQIVPTPASHAPKEVTSPTKVTMSNIVQDETSLGILPLVQPPPPPPLADQTISTISIQEKMSPEELMLQKIAERRAERAKRHEERERKKKEKEKRRKEKERKKQLRLKIKTENMIKKALRIETEALAMGENLDEEEEVMDATPSCWPSIATVANTPLKPAGKGILVSQGFRTMADEESEQKKLKCVKFADGVIPGEGTSPSGGEELSSPPPPKEKRFKKMKKKLQKKKIKVKIIRKPSTDSPDDEELDNLPPPSPPPGSPPPHVFPARIKTHTINNIHPSYATGAPLMPVGNYTSQFRPNIPMTVPPPIHNLPHHVTSAPRAPPQIVPQHGPPVHGPMPHGVPHSIPTHPHGLSHHPSGPRL